MNRETLISELIRDENNILKPYLDCCGKYWRLCTCQNKGKLTIGIGRNLDDVGISLEESSHLCNNNIDQVSQELDRLLPWWKDLDEVRQRVLVNMAFNMGISKLIDNNPHMLAACQRRDYQRASDEMLEGPWVKQVGDRARRLAQMMRTGLS